jgi:VWFA-related protein
MKPVLRSTLPLLALFLAPFAIAQDQSASPAPPPAVTQPAAPIERTQQQQTPPDQVTPPLLRHDPEETMVLTSNVRAVVLDVVVTDAKGHVVHGLQKSDFHVVEGGQPQTLNSFHEHTFNSTAAAQPPKLPPNSFTNFVPAGSSDAYTVILIDAANNSPQVQSYVRSQLISFMKSIPAGNPVAIFQIDSTHMHLIQGFSSDPAVLLEAVESKRNDISIPLISPHERNYVTTQFRQENLDQSLQSMGRYLAGFPGRKNLIWFSGNIPRSFWGGGLGSPFPDEEDFSTEIANATDALTLSRVAVYPIDARGIETDPAFSAAHRGMPSIGSSNAFYTRRFYDHSDIEDVADRTGGKAFYNTNGLKQAMAEVLEDGSNFYTIAYTPTSKKWDGSYRTVKIETNQPGLHLEYRHGYYANNETPAQVRRVAALRRIAAAAKAKSVTPNQSAKIDPTDGFLGSMQLGAVPPTEIIFTASLAPGTTVQKVDRAAPPLSAKDLPPDLLKKPLRDYSILFAVNPNSLHFTATPDGIHHAEFHFVTVIYDDQGQEINSQESTVNLNLKPDTYKDVMKCVLATRQVLDVPAKGNYFFRFGVHDTIADRIGAMEIPVDDVKLGIAGPGQTLTP